MRTMLLTPMLLAVPSVDSGLSAQANPTVAVLPFENLSGFRSAQAVLELRSRVEERLVGSKALSVLSRDRIDKILGELELGTSELAAEEQSASFGKLLGAGLLVSGSITAADYRSQRSRGQQSSSLRVGICVRCTDARSHMVLAMRSYFGVVSRRQMAKPEALLLEALGNAVQKFEKDAGFVAAMRHPTAEEGAVHHVAVLPFANETKNRARVFPDLPRRRQQARRARSEKYSAEIRRFVASSFHASPKHLLLDRERLDAALEEAGLQQADLSDPNAAPLREGLRVLGARYLVTGRATPGQSRKSTTGKRKNRQTTFWMTAGFRLEVIEIATGKLVFQKSFTGTKSVTLPGRGAGRRATGDLYLQALEVAFAKCRRNPEFTMFLGTKLPERESN